MTGPEHYREAEELISGTVKSPEGHVGTPHPHVIALAQVHATLALAAAVGNNEAGRGQTVDESNAWYRTAGTQPPEVTP